MRGQSEGRNILLIEVIAVALGITNVSLLIRRNIWNYPFGIVMVLIYGFIFYDAKLYSEALLQGFFLIIQFYGWWKWHHAIADEGEVMVNWSAPITTLLWIIVTIVLATGFGWMMATYTDAAAPYLDASVAAGSVTAQILLSLRRIENWVYWVAIDVLSIGLFIYRELYLTAGLYVVFLVLASAGLISWARRGAAAKSVPA